MSGAAGGTRIKKEDLKVTIRDYRDNVLKPLGLDTSYNITGVRSRPEKEIFGDIDVVVSFPGGDKKELKQTLAKFIEQVNKIPEIPQKNNKKYFIHGSIVSILYPISGKENEYVQIDNIVTASKDEGKFTYKMLDLPAQEQGLALGLVKAIFTELNQNQIDQLFKDLKITNIEKPGEGEEYDFNLNPSELSLKIVKIGTSEGKTIWKSNKFSDIKTALSALGIDIEKDKFDTIVNKIKKFKNRRSIDRLKGMYARNIRVGDAEVGLEKGIKKQQSLDVVSILQEKYNPLVRSLTTPLISEMEDKSSIAIFPGKFKPPHKDHLARIQAASKSVGPLGTVKVLISPKSSNPNPNQETITADQSLAIFNLYKNKGLLPDNVEFQISPDPSPVLSAYKEFETNKEKSPEEQQPYIAVFGKEEAARFAGISKIPNITINDFPEANIGDESATNIRIALKNGEDISKFLPKGINSEEYNQALNITSLNELVTQSEIDNVERIADEWFEEYGIDIKFTRHFLERINDTRNGKPISAEELENIFTKTADKYGKKLANLPDDFQAVLHSLRTNINLPFVLNYDGKNDEMNLVAKTIMRKRNFQTSNPKLTLQEIYTEFNKPNYSKLIKPITKAGGQGILFTNINEAVYKSNPLQNTLREKYKDFLEKLIIIDKGEQLELNQIRILPKYRNQNIGSKIMADIVKYADINNKILTLTPTEDFGSTQDRLESFYKKFGFTNKKQPIKTDDTMVRPLSEAKNHNIRYWALYSNIFNKLKDNPTVNYNIFKDKLQGEQLKALEYFYNTYFQNDVVSINENATYSENIDYKQHIKDLTKYYLTIYPNLTSMPKVKFIHNNKENAAHIHTKTGYYDPNTKTIVIYTEGRHPRDIINTFSHEIIHFMQDLEGRLTNINSDNTTQDTELNNIEKQAYLEGSIMFRNYKDSIKENTKLDPFGLIKIIHETFGS